MLISEVGNGGKIHRWQKNRYHGGKKTPTVAKEKCFFLPRLSPKTDFFCHY